VENIPALTFERVRDGDARCIDVAATTPPVAVGSTTADEGVVVAKRDADSGKGPSVDDEWGPW
jgi:hypothetical protein